MRGGAVAFVIAAAAWIALPALAGGWRVLRRPVDV